MREGAFAEREASPLQEAGPTRMWPDGCRGVEAPLPLVGRGKGWGLRRPTAHQASEASLVRNVSGLDLSPLPPTPKPLPTRGRGGGEAPTGDNFLGAGRDIERLSDVICDTAAPWRQRGLQAQTRLPQTKLPKNRHMNSSWRWRLSPNAERGKYSRSVVTCSVTGRPFAPIAIASDCAE